MPIPRRPDERGGRAGHHAAAEHLVEIGQREVEPAFEIRHVLLICRRCLDARKGHETFSGDLEEVLAEQVTAGAQLVNLDLAGTSHARTVAVQLDETVDQCVLRMRFVVGERRKDQRGAARGAHEGRKLVDELRERELGRAEFAGAAESVDDHEARAVRLDRRGDEREKPGEAVAHQLVIARDEEHSVGDGTGVVERHRPFRCDSSLLCDSTISVMYRTMSPWATR